MIYEFSIIGIIGLIGIGFIFGFSFAYWLFKNWNEVKNEKEEKKTYEKKWIGIFVSDNWNVIIYNCYHLVFCWI